MKGTNSLKDTNDKKLTEKSRKPKESYIYERDWNDNNNNNNNDFLIHTKKKYQEEIPILHKLI